MDPLTHALAGASLAYAATGKHLGRRALAIGAAAALVPDVDVLIRSAADPLLAIEHHRGFTHSLLFVPFGGSIAALPFIAKLDRVQRRAAFIAGIIAYASHALLDSATTYGTRLFWPFSRHRVGLDVISIIDPLFTLVALIAVIAAFKARRRVVSAAIAIAVIWLVLGFVQRERASAAQARVATARGDHLVRGAVFPTLGNTIVWRSIYETGGTLRIDRIRVPWFSAAAVANGASVPLVTAEAIGTDARLLRDFHRFAWFSDRWVARAARPDLPRRRALLIAQRSLRSGVGHSLSSERHRMDQPHDRAARGARTVVVRDPRPRCCLSSAAVKPRPNTFSSALAASCVSSAANCSASVITAPPLPAESSPDPSRALPSDGRRYRRSSRRT